MAVGTVRQEISNIPNINKHTNGVLSAPLPEVHMPPRTNISATSSTYQKSQETTSAETPESGEETTETTETSAPTKEERQKARKEGWSALEQARKEKREAEAIRKQNEEFVKVKNSPQKLQALAKSLGLTSDELLMQLNNERMSIPSDKKLTPEEQQVAEARSLKESLDRQSQQLATVQFQIAKDSHINKAILPHLVKEPETFEFCHKYGIDQCASEVYDYCNEYQLANSGQLLNEREVLQEFEDALFQEWENAHNMGKGLKKTSKYFESDKTSENSPEDVLGATVQTMTEGKKITQQTTQMAQETPQKRIAKKPAVSPQAMDRMAQVAQGNANKLSGGINTSATFDKAARRQRLLNGE